MDLNAVQGDDDGQEDEPMAAVLSDDTARLHAEVQELKQMVQAHKQALNAIGQSKSGGYPSRSAGGKDRVPGLTAADIGRLRAENRCFKCKRVGHMKNECPNAQNNRLN